MLIIAIGHGNEYEHPYTETLEVSFAPTFFDELCEIVCESRGRSKRSIDEIIVVSDSLQATNYDEFYYKGM